MNQQTAFGIGGFAILALLGNGFILCNKDSPCNNRSPVYLEGTVKKETGSAVLSSKYLKSMDLTYVIQIQTSEGVYTTSVLRSTKRDLETLALAIEEGTKVRFPTIADNGTYRFGEDKIGEIYADELNVLSKE